MKKFILPGILLLAVLAVVFSGNRSNPPAEREVEWDSQTTKALFYRACADCHSNETKWPWYSQLAPVSWMLIDHVEDGRKHFNISAAKLGDADEAAEEFREGKMPLENYLWLHPEAKLDGAEREQLISGLTNTFGSKKSSKKSGDAEQNHDGEDH